ncbi:uncharacterized protein LOC129200865 isoform X3 [Grus americana]|uniref:uncharacterized protein LOC129200865 isoform X3 n=1 Tax=Grus americana TaxID=9117 RepID=UPI002407A6EC|nr:uncharacterized protein LOC129200865 isoform X3 [Grus americana]
MPIAVRAVTGQSQRTFGSWKFPLCTRKKFPTVSCPWLNKPNVLSLCSRERCFSPQIISVASSGPAPTGPCLSCPEDPRAGHSTPVFSWHQETTKEFSQTREENGHLGAWSFLYMKLRLFSASV